MSAPHDGPPYPILVDDELGGWTVSIWADPDVGTGTFYFIVDGLADGASATSDGSIRIGAQPSDGRLEETFVDAQRAGERDQYQWFGEVEFDRRGPWDMRFLVTGPAGTEEAHVPVDVTPPGLGRLDLLWYLSPFLALAFLWIKAVLKRREYAREAAAEPPE